MKRQFIFIDPVSSDLAKFFYSNHSNHSFIDSFWFSLCQSFFFPVTDHFFLFLALWCYTYLIEVMIASVCVSFLISEKRVFITNSLFFVCFVFCFCFFYLKLFFFISWRLITLQHCSGFCHTLK